MERKYNNTDKLQKAGEFLEQKGLDLNEYTIFDTSGKFKQQIPIATWLTDFAELCGGNVTDTEDRQLNIPDVSNLACALLRKISEENMCSVTADEEIHAFLNKHACY